MVFPSRPTTFNRTGFTLVELMVSIALIMFIMAILSQAFTTGMEMFGDMKAVGDMEERLRSATLILRRDLAADHFEARRRLSDLNFWKEPVREGFFKIFQGSGSIPEGADLDQIPSYRANYHALHFSVKLRGNRPDKFFSASGNMGALFAQSTTFFGHPIDSTFQEPGGQVYNSPWAEIAYSLRSEGETAGGTPLFSLRRHQRVVVPDNQKLNYPTPIVPFSQAVLYGEMAWTPVPYKPPPPPPSPLYLEFLNPSDLAGTSVGVPILPRRSIGLPDKPNSGPPYPLGGASVLLTDVISFNVRVLKYTLPNPTYPAGLLDDDFYDLPGGVNPPPWNFDTYAPLNNVGATSYLIKALQISIRVWDRKTQQARQVTIIQDM